MLTTTQKISAWRKYFRTRDVVKREAITKIPLTKEDKIAILEDIYEGWEVSISITDNQPIQFRAKAPQQTFFRRMLEDIHTKLYGAQRSARAFHLLTSSGSKSISITGGESVEFLI